MDKNINQKIEQKFACGVKLDNTFKEKDWYRDRIIEMVRRIDNDQFLKRIYIILKNHIEKRGN